MIIIEINRPSNKSPSIINYQPYGKNCSPVMTVDKSKSIPITMAYMERIMTKLQENGSSKRNKRSRDKCVQAGNTQVNEYHIDSLSNFTDISTKIALQSHRRNISCLLHEQSSHAKNNGSHGIFTDNSSNHVSKHASTHIKSFSQLQPISEPHR